jgi:parallel beta-helix repeat protein
MSALLVLLLWSTGHAAIYYVSKTGSDTNTGTEASPWRTIRKASKTLAPGDTVYIREGIYRERVVPRTSGKLGKFITYAAYPQETVTIDGRRVSVPDWTGLVYLETKKYIRISGLRVINSSRDGILVDGCRHIVIENNHTYNTVGSGIAVWNSYDIMIDQNEVRLACNDGQNECITVGGTDSFEVAFNHVHHSGPGTNGGEGIDVKDGSSNGKVYGNHVHDINRLGIYVDAWDKHTFNIEVFSNVVHDCAGDGYTLASEMGGFLENIKVYNNIAYQNKWIGILLANYGDVATHPMKNILVVNNTLFKNGHDWGGGIAIDPPDATNIIVRNNIVSKNLSFQISVNAELPSDQYSVDHNLVDGFRGNPEGEIYGTDYVEANPKFLKPAAGNFHLRMGSPAVDTGSPEYAPAEDHDGAFRPWPRDGGYDMGAFEAGSS